MGFDAARDGAAGVRFVVVLDGALRGAVALGFGAAAAFRFEDAFAAVAFGFGAAAAFGFGGAFAAFGFGAAAALEVRPADVCRLGAGVDITCGPSVVA